MKQRFLIIKKIYPNYLVFIKYKNKYVMNEIDYFIYNNFKSNINKIVLDKLDIVLKEEYSDNNYELCYIKTKLINFFKEVKK